MNLEFNKRRALLNHNIFKNAFLSRLTDSGDLLSNADLPPQERMRRLAAWLIGAESINRNMEVACQTWRAPTGIGDDVPNSVRLLLAEIRTSAEYQPTSALPGADEIESWLSDMQNLVDSLPAWHNLAAPARERLALAFWTAALHAHDLLHDLNPNSERFWNYVSLREKR